MPTEQFPFKITDKMTDAEIRRRMNDAGYPLDGLTYSLGRTQPAPSICPYCRKRAEAVYICAQGVAVPAHMDCLIKYYNTGRGEYLDYMEKNGKAAKMRANFAKVDKKRLKKGKKWKVLEAMKLKGSAKDRLAKKLKAEGKA